MVKKWLFRIADRYVEVFSIVIDIYYWFVIDKYDANSLLLLLVDCREMIGMHPQSGTK